VHALPLPQVAELGTAGEAVGEHGRGRASRVHCGQQRGRRDRDAQVIVPAFGTEVAGQAAAAVNYLGMDAGPFQEGLVGREPEDSAMVAVGLDDGGHAGQVRRQPAGNAC
jgi:hypothetical protein